jgi:hypothetical protein
VQIAERGHTDNVPSHTQTDFKFWANVPTAELHAATRLQTLLTCRDLFDRKCSDAL